jgi:hypothetical protein
MRQAPQPMPLNAAQIGQYGLNVAPESSVPRPLTPAEHQQYGLVSQPTPNSNILVPDTKGPIAGVAGKMKQPYIQGPYTPGAPIASGSTVVSTPTENQVNSAQHELVTIKQMKPLFQQIANAAPHFLKSGQMAEVRGEKVLGWLHRNLPGNTNLSGDIESKLGMSPQDLSNYNALQTNLQTLAEQYMNAHGWANNEINSAKALTAVSPSAAEAGPSYVNRMSNLFNYLNKGIGNVNRNVLSSGLSTVPAQSTSINSQPTAQPQVQNAPIPPQATPEQILSSAGFNKNDLNTLQAKKVPLQDKQGNMWMVVNGKTYMRPKGWKP